MLQCIINHFLVFVARLFDLLTIDCKLALILYFYDNEIRFAKKKGSTKLRDAFFYVEAFAIFNQKPAFLHPIFYVVLARLWCIAYEFSFQGKYMRRHQKRLTPPHENQIRSIFSCLDRY